MTYYTKKNAHILNVMLFFTGIIIAKGYTGEDYLNQIKDEEIFEQFDFLTSSPNGEKDDWGEQIDFSVEKILDMPTVCEVQMNPTKKGSVTDSDLHSEGDNPKMESEQGLQNSSTLDREDLHKYKNQAKELIV